MLQRKRQMTTPVKCQQTRQQEPIPVSTYILTLCIGIIGSNSLLLAPIAPVVAISFSKSVPNVMLASSAFGLGTGFSALFLARYIDVFGAFRSIKISMLTISLSTLLSAVSPNLLSLIFSQLTAGLATGIAIPAIYVATSFISPPSLEKKTLGIVLVGWTLSLVAGVSFSSLIAENSNWRYVYFLLSSLNVISITLLHFSVKNETPCIRKTNSPLKILNNKEIVHQLIICAAIMTSFYGVYSFLGDYIFTKLQKPLSANGISSILYGIGFGSVALFRGKLKHICENLNFSTALLILSLNYLSIFFSEKYIAICIFMTTLGCINHIAVNSLIAKLNYAGGDEKGNVMGLNSAVTYFSVFISGSALGFLYSIFGFKTIVLISFILCLTASAFSKKNTN